MGIFKKKQQPVVNNIELKCSVEGCSFTCSHTVLFERHMNWKHPELTQGTKKA
ncbi:MAG: hypothetical protein Q8Q07_02810 [Dehalococcoidales bacterium]|nr:hypothetical protein [Dehalococcoidales bacterium]